MSRFVKWVTLTPEERQQVDPASRSGGTDTGSGPLIQSHSASITLPNGQPCPFAYTRYGIRSHRFGFLPPVYQHLWHNQRLANDVRAIQEQAQALSKEAFRLAGQQEQKETRRRTPPPGHCPTASGSPARIKPKNAELLAGRYAVCIQFGSGLLLPIGTAQEDPDRITQELEEGKYAHEQLHGAQKLVIGLCCRWERHWRPAQFVVYPPSHVGVTTTQEATAAASASAIPEGDPVPAVETASTTPPGKPARKARRKASVPPRAEPEN
jgi:hypothetical protein